jgi:hypothetical protein
MADAKRWLISYAAINLDGSDVQLRENKSLRLGRNEVAIGEVVAMRWVDLINWSERLDLLKLRGYCCRRRSS